MGAVLSAIMAGASAGQDISGRASVIDGDTIEVRGVRIRLHGIDAPENGQTCRRNGKPWLCGSASAFALDGLVAGRYSAARSRPTATGALWPAAPQVPQSWAPKWCASAGRWITGIIRTASMRPRKPRPDARSAGFGLASSCRPGNGGSCPVDLDQYLPLRTNPRAALAPGNRHLSWAFEGLGQNLKAGTKWLAPN